VRDAVVPSFDDEDESDSILVIPAGMLGTIIFIGAALLAPEFLKR
jgi:hypothetical protein